MPMDCPKCGGGESGDLSFILCPLCEGTGWVDTAEDRALDALIVMAFLDPDAPDLMDDADEISALTDEDLAALERIDIDAIIARAMEGRY